MIVTLFLASTSAEGAGRKTKQLQAYRGAPPTIPHQVKELGRKKCLSCHFQGLDLGIRQGEAYKTPHPERENCLQCHLPQKGVKLFQKNDFKPLPPKNKKPSDSEAK